MERIYTYLRTHDAVGPLLGPAFDNLVNGIITDFIAVLVTFNQTRALRSFNSANEATFQGIVEIILDKPNDRVPELALVMDGTKIKGEGRYGFADIFIPATTKPTGERTFAILLELKYVTLEVILKGATSNQSRSQEYKDIEKLEDQLSMEGDDKILERKYMYFSKTLQRHETTTIRDILEGGVEQLKMYMKVVANGKAKAWKDSGIIDGRIKVGDGNDVLQGHLVIGIGRSRFIVRTQVLQTSKAYYTTSC